MKNLIKFLAIGTTSTVIFVGWAFIITILFRGRALESCIGAAWLTASTLWLHWSLFGKGK